MQSTWYAQTLDSFSPCFPFPSIVAVTLMTVITNMIVIHSPEVILLMVVLARALDVAFFLYNAHPPGCSSLEVTRFVAVPRDPK